MNQLLFIWAVTSYLLSLAGALLLSFFYRKLPPGFLKAFYFIHVSLLILWLVFSSTAHTLNEPGNSNYLFLFFFCSGVLVSGLVLRGTASKLLKFYFAIYPLSAVVFLLSPSSLIGFIASGKPGAMETGSIRLYENIYLVSQQSALVPAVNSHAFKITREMGVFHKTLARDIILDFYPDSVVSSPLENGKGVSLRLFYPCGNATCSLDTVIPFGVQRDSSRIITRKVQNH